MRGLISDWLALDVKPLTLSPFWRCIKFNTPIRVWLALISLWTIQSNLFTSYCGFEQLGHEFLSFLAVLNENIKLIYLSVSSFHIWVNLSHNTSRLFSMFDLLRFLLGALDVILQSSWSLALCFSSFACTVVPSVHSSTEKSLWNGRQKQ